MRPLLIQGEPTFSDGAISVLTANGFDFDLLRQVRISRVRRYMQDARATVSISTVCGVGYMLATMKEARSTVHGATPDRSAIAS